MDTGDTDVLERVTILMTAFDEDGKPTQVPQTYTRHTSEQLREQLHRQGLIGLGDPLKPGSGDLDVNGTKCTCLKTVQFCDQRTYIGIHPHTLLASVSPSLAWKCIWHTEYFAEQSMRYYHNSLPDCGTKYNEV